MHHKILAYLESGMASPLKAPPVAAPFVLPFALTPPGCTAAHIGQTGTIQEDTGQLKHDGLGFSPSYVELLSIVSLLERLAALPPSLSNVCK